MANGLACPYVEGSRFVESRCLGLWTGILGGGVFDLIWRDFDVSHQPIQAWGDNTPGVTILVCIPVSGWWPALWLCCGGVSNERKGGAG